MSLDNVSTPLVMKIGLPTNLLFTILQELALKYFNVTIRTTLSLPGFASVTWAKMALLCLFFTSEVWMSTIWPGWMLSDVFNLFLSKVNKSLGNKSNV